MLQIAQRSPPLEDLEAFVLVAETGSFTSAAKRLSVPKSTISRRIARLEEALQMQLVMRTSRKLGLTESGATYLESVAPALARIEEANRSAQEEREQPRGHLRLTAPFHLAAGWLAYKLSEFRGRYPEVTVEMVVEDRGADLVADGIDAALRSATQLEDSSLVARRLATISFGVYGSSAFLDRRGRPSTIQDLASYDFALLKAHQARARLQFEGPDGKVQVDVRVPVASNDYAFLHRSVMHGGVLAVLPSTLPTSDAVGLEHVLPQYKTASSNLYLVYPAARRVPAKLAALRDFLVEQADTIGMCANARP